MAMFATLPKLNINDMVLFLTLAYSAMDITSEWASFSKCRKPIHLWLLASFGLLLVFRLIHIVGTHSAKSHDGVAPGEILMNMRVKGAVPQLMFYMTWFVVMPGFSVWTLAGSIWMWEVSHFSPQCLPPQFYWFSVLWQALSYAWIFAHMAIGVVALRHERQIRSAEADLRAMEDPDTLERWGNVSRNHSLTSVAAVQDRQRASKPGLSPADVLALGGLCTHSDQSCCNPSMAAADECPICLGEFHAGDKLRKLPTCVHVFHRSCIDLWLLQSASCPLCKADVPQRSSQTQPISECLC
jgi:hypothetical protein